MTASPPRLKKIWVEVMVLEPVFLRVTVYLFKSKKTRGGRGRNILRNSKRESKKKNRWYCWLVAPLDTQGAPVASIEAVISQEAGGKGISRLQKSPTFDKIPFSQKRWHTRGTGEKGFDWNEVVVLVRSEDAHSGLVVRGVTADGVAHDERVVNNGIILWEHLVSRGSKNNKKCKGGGGGGNPRKSKLTRKCVIRSSVCGEISKSLFASGAAWEGESIGNSHITKEGTGISGSILNISNPGHILFRHKLPIHKDADGIVRMIKKSDIVNMKFNAQLPSIDVSVSSIEDLSSRVSPSRGSSNKAKKSNQHSDLHDVIAPNSTVVWYKNKLVNTSETHSCSFMRPCARKSPQIERSLYKKEIELSRKGAITPDSRARQRTYTLYG